MIKNVNNIFKKAILTHCQKVREISQEDNELFINMQFNLIMCITYNFEMVYGY